VLIVTATYPPLYPSLARLLAPAAFARVTGRALGHAHLTREAIAGGLSGARIERLRVVPATEERVSATAPAAPGSAYILKNLDPTANWLMRASDDSACRELQLTQSPLWSRLPPAIWAPVLACVASADGTGVLLLPDLTSDLFTASGSYEPVDAALVARIIAGLAALHATFWESAELSACPWLTSPAAALFALTPARLTAALTHEPLTHEPLTHEHYAARALGRWSQLPRLIASADAAAIQRVLDAPARLVEALRAAPATLAHGDAWLANLGERNGRLILLDWALCTAGPATFDSLWLAHTWRALDPDVTLAQHRQALDHRGVMAVRDDATWQLLTDLAWVRTTLMGLEALIGDVVSPTSPVPQPVALSRLRFWCRRTAHILEHRRW
jgi:hypothetical protein